MSNVTSQDIDAAVEAAASELQRLRKDWWWFLLLGILLMIGGLLALAYPAFSSVGITIVLGAVLIIGGLATIVSAFWTGKWSAFFLQILVVGVFRIVVALVERFPQWGWALLNGVVTLLAGIIIYDSFPVSAFWVIGLLVGLELLFNGWTWIMTSIAVKNIPDVEGASD